VLPAGFTPVDVSGSLRVRTAKLCGFLHLPCEF